MSGEILQGLASDDPGIQMCALHQLNEMLQFAPGELSVSPYVPAVAKIVRNPNNNVPTVLMCLRALNCIIDIDPRQASNIISEELLTVFCGKLTQGCDNDIAEQCVKLLELLTNTHAAPVLDAGALHAFTLFFAHFDEHVQIRALQGAVRLCSQVNASNFKSAGAVVEALPKLADCVELQDANMVRMACTCFMKLVSTYSSFKPKKSTTFATVTMTDTSSDETPNAGSTSSSSTAAALTADQSAASASSSSSSSSSESASTSASASSSTSPPDGWQLHVLRMIGTDDNVVSWLRVIRSKGIGQEIASGLEKAIALVLRARPELVNVLVDEGILSALRVQLQISGNPSENTSDGSIQEEDEGRIVAPIARRLSAVTSPSFSPMVAPGSARGGMSAHAQQNRSLGAVVNKLYGVEDQLSNTLKLAEALVPSCPTFDDLRALVVKPQLTPTSEARSLMTETNGDGMSMSMKAGSGIILAAMRTPSPETRHHTDNMPSMEVDSNNDDDESGVAQAIAAAQTAGDAQGAQIWACPACTVHNELYLSMCQCCGHMSPAISIAADSAKDRPCLTQLINDAKRDQPTLSIDEVYKDNSRLLSLLVDKIWFPMLAQVQATCNSTNRTRALEMLTAMAYHAQNSALRRVVSEAEGAPRALGRAPAVGVAAGVLTAALHGRRDLDDTDVVAAVRLLLVLVCQEPTSILAQFRRHDVATTLMKVVTKQQQRRGGGEGGGKKDGTVVTSATVTADKTDANTTSLHVLVDMLKSKCEATVVASSSSDLSMLPPPPPPVSAPTPETNTASASLSPAKHVDGGRESKKENNKHADGSGNDLKILGDRMLNSWSTLVHACVAAQNSSNDDVISTADDIAMSVVHGAEKQHVRRHNKKKVGGGGAPARKKRKQAASPMCARMSLGASLGGAFRSNNCRNDIRMSGSDNNNDNDGNDSERGKARSESNERCFAGGDEHGRQFAEEEDGNFDSARDENTTVGAALVEIEEVLSDLHSIVASRGLTVYELSNCGILNVILQALGKDNNKTGSIGVGDLGLLAKIVTPEAREKFTRAFVLNFVGPDPSSTGAFARLVAALHAGINSTECLPVQQRSSSNGNGAVSNAFGLMGQPLRVLIKPHVSAVALPLKATCMLVKDKQAQRILPEQVMEEEVMRAVLFRVLEQGVLIEPLASVSDVEAYVWRHMKTTWAGQRRELDYRIVQAAQTKANALNGVLNHPNNIHVGCVVARGPSWCWAQQDGQDSSNASGGGDEGDIRSHPIFGGRSARTRTLSSVSSVASGVSDNSSADDNTANGTATASASEEGGGLGPGPRVGVVVAMNLSDSLHALTVFWLATGRVHTYRWNHVGRFDVMVLALGSKVVVPDTPVVKANSAEAALSDARENSKGDKDNTSARRRSRRSRNSGGSGAQNTRSKSGSRSKQPTKTKKSGGVLSLDQLQEQADAFSSKYVVGSMVGFVRAGSLRFQEDARVSAVDKQRRLVRVCGEWVPVVSQRINPPPSTSGVYTRDVFRHESEWLVYQHQQHLRQREEANKKQQLNQVTSGQRKSTRQKNKIKKNKKAAGGGGGEGDYGRGLNRSSMEALKARMSGVLTGETEHVEVKCTSSGRWRLAQVMHTSPILDGNGSIAGDWRLVVCIAAAASPYGGTARPDKFQWCLLSDATVRPVNVEQSKKNSGDASYGHVGGHDMDSRWVRSNSVVEDIQQLCLHHKQHSGASVVASASAVSTKNDATNNVDESVDKNLENGTLVDVHIGQLVYVAFHMDRLYWCQGSIVEVRQPKRKSNADTDESEQQKQQQQRFTIIFPEGDAVYNLRRSQFVVSLPVWVTHLHVMTVNKADSHANKAGNINNNQTQNRATQASEIVEDDHDDDYEEEEGDDDDDEGSMLVIIQRRPTSGHIRAAAAQQAAQAAAHAAQATSRSLVSRASLLAMMTEQVGAAGDPGGLGGAAVLERLGLGTPSLAREYSALHDSGDSGSAARSHVVPRINSTLSAPEIVGAAASASASASRAGSRSGQLSQLVDLLAASGGAGASTASRLHERLIRMRQRIGGSALSGAGPSAGGAYDDDDDGDDDDEDDGDEGGLAGLASGLAGFKKELRNLLRSASVPHPNGTSATGASAGPVATGSHAHAPGSRMTMLNSAGRANAAAEAEQERAARAACPVILMPAVGVSVASGTHGYVNFVTVDPENTVYNALSQAPRRARQLWQRQQGQNRIDDTADTQEDANMLKGGEEEEEADVDGRTDDDYSAGDEQLDGHRSEFWRQVHPMVFALNLQSPLAKAVFGEGSRPGSVTGALGPCSLVSLDGGVAVDKLGVVTVSPGTFPTVSAFGVWLTQGSWYFEVEVVKSGLAQVGWVDSEFSPCAKDGRGCGDDVHSWAVDASREKKWNGSSHDWGRKWVKGDVLGCALDIRWSTTPNVDDATTRGSGDLGSESKREGRATMRFAMNGDWYGAMGVAFEDVAFAGTGLRPAITLNNTFAGRVRLGGSSGLPLRFSPPTAPAETAVTKNVRIATGAAGGSCASENAAEASASVPSSSSRGSQRKTRRAAKGSDSATGSSVSGRARNVQGKKERSSEVKSTRGTTAAYKCVPLGELELGGSGSYAVQAMDVDGKQEEEVEGSDTTGKTTQSCLQDGDDVSTAGMRVGILGSHSRLPHSTQTATATKKVNEHEQQECTEIRSFLPFVNALAALADVNISGCGLRLALQSEKPSGDARPMTLGEYLPSTVWTNERLTRKLMMHLQDPLLVCTGSMPTWCAHLAQERPFLFPFEARVALFELTSFGISRALHHMYIQADNTDGHAGADNNNDDDDENGGRGGRGDGRPRTSSTTMGGASMGSLTRIKAKVPRAEVLEAAVRLMEGYAADKSVLGVEFSGETGHGLGPTLEFYAVTCHEVQRSDLKLWRCSSDESSSGAAASGGVGSSFGTTGSVSSSSSSSAKSYVAAPQGLYPRLLQPGGDTSSHKSTQPQRTTAATAKVISYFRFMGRFIGKALLDSRLLDLPFSLPLCKAVLGHELGETDIISIDASLGASVLLIVDLARRLQRNPTNEELCEQVKMMSLDFTMPGRADLELIPNGSNVDVDATNITQYVDALLDMLLRKGIGAQVKALRAGIDEVFPSKALGVFTPAELQVLLCGGHTEDWSKETILESIACKHGYTPESKQISFLAQVLSELNADQRRLFLRFSTGCPRLPVGGWAGLRPCLTVVRKDVSTPDMHLPSCSTCQVYLKLPVYTNVSSLRDKLLMAIHEGQGRFDFN